jgi:3-phosphoshikimate 1-carboxyvinyltransferase
MSDTLTIRPSRDLHGAFDVPGDKSISHRAAILGAIATGDTPISGYLTGEDCLCTARALQSMGVQIDGLGAADMVVHGVGMRGLRAPDGPLDLGNSGTGMRLLMGVLAGQPFTTTLIGDASLSKRPMDRIAKPLGEMGITISGQGERRTPPVTVHGGEPHAIAYHSPVASAQVKSAVLLAGLYADGVTTVIEPALSRDHTERMLAAFGASVETQGPVVAVRGRAELRGCPVAVPGDCSSAAFPLVAAILTPGSTVTARGILLNPTRAAFLNVLDRMGAHFEVSNCREVTGELVGDVTAHFGPLHGAEIAGAEIPHLIDELPILAVAAALAEGETLIRDAAELRVKESDRLALMAAGLTAMGASVRELPDGLVIHGPARLQAVTVDADNDHRIAMSFAVAGMLAEGETTIDGAGTIATSFPDFAPLMRDAGADIEPA